MGAGATHSLSTPPPTDSHSPQARYPQIPRHYYGYCTNPDEKARCVEELSGYPL